MDNQQGRIRGLISVLNEASDSYYNTSTSIMSDKQWDTLFDELKGLEDDTNIIFSNSPTQNVGYEVKSKLEKVKHTIPLKSLGKTKDLSDVSNFMKDHKVLLMLKGDGLTTELIYEDGKLKQGSTRGNAIIGEDITHNVKVFKNVPLEIDFKGYLKIAGEAVIFDKDFENINNLLKCEDKYSNSRNLVAGSVRQLNSKICNSRNVNFLAFNLLECEDKDSNNIEFDTLKEQFSFLEDNGFSIIPFAEFYLPNEERELSFYVDDLKECANAKGIPIDGIVIRHDDLAYGKALGETEHHPNNAIAYKFYNEEFETEYVKTKWQVSRTGLINPVAIFKAVDLDGAITTKATLHNIDYFNNLQLGRGDIITIARMNEVIPKVLNNQTRSNTEEIPCICPFCGHKTEIKKLKTAQVLKCTNIQCPSKNVAAIEHFCSRDAMNIVGFSEATIEKFINEGFIKEIPDIYTIEQYKKEIITLEGFGIKSYNNLIASINNSKICELNNFLYALGITSVGKGTSKDLANHFKTINSFIEHLNNRQSLNIIKDIGEITNNDIYSWWDQIINKELLAALLEYIEIKEIQQNNSKGIFIGMKVYCTGTFKNYNKAELKTIIEEKGGTFSNGYAKSLSMLVVGSIKGSTKVAKAHTDNIKVISENEFIEIINKDNDIAEKIIKIENNIQTKEPIQPKEEMVSTNFKQTTLFN